MAIFPCPKGDLLRGEIVVGGENLISVFFPEGIDFATADATLLEFPHEALRGDLRSMAGRSMSEITSFEVDLGQTSGILANCSPCGHRWVYESAALSASQATPGMAQMS
jgi:hypothetical protein